jgi:hypothetical protein
MATTTDVVTKSHKSSLWGTYRRHGYFFREAAMLTIAIGYFLHLYRVIFGDDATLQYVVTQATDILLTVPMTYAAVAGIAGWRRMRFVNRAHKTAVRAAVVYITASVPLHIYVGLVLNDMDLYVRTAGYWFSYFLLMVVYPAFLTMLWKLNYEE